MTNAQTSNIAGKKRFSKITKRVKSTSSSFFHYFQSRSFGPPELAELLLLLTVCILPLQTRIIVHTPKISSAASEFGTRSIYATDITILAAFVVLLVFWDRIVTPGRLRAVAPLLFAGGFLCFTAFVSVLFANDPSVAVFWFWNLCIGVVFFTTLILVRPSWKRIAWTLAATTSIQGIISVLEWRFQYVPASSLLGMSRQLADVLGTQVISTAPYGRVLRAYGTLPHPNIVAGYLVIGAIACMHLFIDLGKQAATLATKQRSAQQLRILIAFMLVMHGAALWTTASRQALLALGIVLAAGATITIIKRNAHWQDTVRIGVALLTPLIVLTLIFPWYLAPRVLSFTNAEFVPQLEQRSVVDRQESFKESINVIQNKWATGAGIGNYTQHYPIPVHNIYLLLFAEIGIFGLFGATAFIALYCTIGQPRRKRVIQHALGLAALIALGIIGLFDHYLWSLHPGTLLLWLVFSLPFLGNHDWLG